MEGTQLANLALAQMPAASMSAPAPAPAGLRINREAAPPPMAPPIPIAAATAAARPAAVPKYMKANATTQNNNFLLGIVGALLGAAIAVGLMVGFTAFTGQRFPILGTVMGAIIGFGARLLYRGTDMTLGAMSAAVALITIGGTLFAMFGVFGLLFSTISIIVGTMFAFKVAS